jgi:hypothetical protein
MVLVRKRLLILATAVGVFLVTGTLVAWAAATTEIDQADAAFQLAGTPRVTQCVGEDSGTPYTQYTVAAYTGAEGDASPAVPTDLVTGGLDHGLSGTLKWTAVKVTFNNLTGRGVAAGTLVLTAPSPAGAAVKVFSGPLTLVVQRDPAGGPVLGRGWLAASTFDPTTLKADGKILANVEVTFAPNMASLTGIYGDATWPQPGGPVPAFSVETGLLAHC